MFDFVQITPTVSFKARQFSTASVVNTRRVNAQLLGRFTSRVVGKTCVDINNRSSNSLRNTGIGCITTSLLSHLRLRLMQSVHLKRSLGSELMPRLSALFFVRPTHFLFCFGRMFLTETSRRCSRTKIGNVFRLGQFVDPRLFEEIRIKGRALFENFKRETVAVFSVLLDEKSVSMSTSPKHAAMLLLANQRANSLTHIDQRRGARTKTVNERFHGGGNYALRSCSSITGTVSV